MQATHIRRVRSAAPSTLGRQSTPGVAAARRTAKWALREGVCVGVACGAGEHVSRVVAGPAAVATCITIGACMSTVATPYLLMMARAWSCSHATRVWSTQASTRGRAARPLFGRRYSLTLCRRITSSAWTEKSMGVVSPKMSVGGESPCRASRDQFVSTLVTRSRSASYIDS